ncbi:hypothetical protein D9619_011849 [Psilocybe cf. subviscida]|uniref:Protein HRI1 n=1 Tax=Psilocybe cf. subviscida TaxID=2480587 RepID=A0A8H5EVX2_9AGAR|nr:hypothetical protein D9619_011849 [Psilocybe cf. subviscida]
MSSISLRRSIRWLPDPPSEPTHTVVLIGPSGVFLDVRFLKASPKQIDWAFAGYRTEVSPNVVEFKHHIDSRTTEPVVDTGTNSTISPGVTLEVGEMVNPETGKMTAYEEIWEEPRLESVSAMFIRNVAGTVWHARVNQWQIALGRDAEGRFWAWQAVKRAGSEWDVIYATGDKSRVHLLSKETENWKKGEKQAWDGDMWVVLDAEG